MGSTSKNSLNKLKVSFSLKESLLSIVSILKVTSWSNMVAKALAVLPTSQGRHGRMEVCLHSLSITSPWPEFSQKAILTFEGSGNYNLSTVFIATTNKIMVLLLCYRRRSQQSLPSKQVCTKLCSIIFICYTAHVTHNLFFLVVQCFRDLRLVHTILHFTHCCNF